MPHFRESQARPITNTEAIGCCLNGEASGCGTPSSVASSALGAMTLGAAF